MSTSGSKSNEHVAHFLVDIHNCMGLKERISAISTVAGGMIKERNPMK